MGKKKAKEPETPAKDEVGIFGQRSARNSPIEFPKQDLTFEVTSNLRVHLNNLCFHDDQAKLNAESTAAKHFWCISFKINQLDKR